MNKFRRIIWASLSVLALAGAMAVPALGQTVEGYNNVGGQIQEEVGAGGPGGGGPGGAGDDTGDGAGGLEAQAQSPTTVSPDTDGDGSLPFTGLDVALLLAAGVVLGAVGFGMRRLTRAPNAA